MTSLDPAAIMAEHTGEHECSGDWWAPEVPWWSPDGCQTYRLAEALTASEAKVAAVRRMAEAPRVYILSTDDVLDELQTCKHGRRVCFNAQCVALAEGGRSSHDRG